MLRALPRAVQEAWFSILQRCLHLQELPQSFLLGHICAMPKPGEASLQNCRPRENSWASFAVIVVTLGFASHFYSAVYSGKIWAAGFTPCT